MNQLHELPGLDIEYFPKFFPESESDQYLNVLLKDLEWKQDEIKLFGITHLQPRLTALYGQEDKTYTYSGIKMQPEPFTKELLNIKKAVELVSGITYTSCLANLYRDGSDSMGWHSDDEKELGKVPVIASVSFGAKRIFHFKHRENKEQKYKLNLEHGSLLIMKGNTQREWKHQLPKTKKVIGSRINLTFRKIY